MFDVESDRKPTSGLPVTGGQSGIWLAQQIEPDSSAYNIVFALHLHGAVDLDRLAAAVRGAVEEAECLHVQVVPGADGPRQHPHPRPVDVTVVDLREAADPDG
ncbi:condensation domain-containing protein, partial [Streptomyces venezuelae]|uniref:condensation domain-containing protein n=1 Tax=Streptomyces venezuelae TaxID=54571 RepID=UPI00278C0757